MVEIWEFCLLKSYEFREFCFLKSYEFREFFVVMLLRPFLWLRIKRDFSANSNNTHSTFLYTTPYASE